MRFLLDTSAFLTAHTEPERLGRQLDLVQDPDNERLVSAVVGWEIAIKWELGRIELPDHPRRWVVDLLERGQMTPVPISFTVALGVADLPGHHRDPFDRLLVSTAIHLDVPVLTSDRVFDAYGVQVLRF